MGDGRVQRLARSLKADGPAAPEVEHLRARLERLGYDNILFTYSDGMNGWAAHAPYDAIVVTAAAERVPQALLDQLAPGGRLVVPVGGAEQELRVYRRTDDGITMDRVCYVAFVPMTGGR